MGPPFRGLGATGLIAPSPGDDLPLQDAYARQRIVSALNGRIKRAVHFIALVLDLYKTLHQVVDLPPSRLQLRRKGFAIGSHTGPLPLLDPDHRPIFWARFTCIGRKLSRTRRVLDTLWPIAVGGIQRRILTAWSLGGKTLALARMRARMRVGAAGGGVVEVPQETPFVEETLAAVGVRADEGAFFHASPFGRRRD